MGGSLRDRLIGAWRLVDVVDVPVDGSPGRHPHGDRPVGLILYTPDGYMSVQIMERERAPVSSADWSSLTPREYAGEARGYFAYAGSFEVDEERETVTHSVEVSLFPGWVGRAQVRVASLDGDRLVLRAASPAMSGGKLVTTRISWVRAGAA
jgi:Lipocalin-like domain